MKILVMRDGTECEVKCRSGKYWVCAETQFRASNPEILEVREVPDPVPTQAADGPLNVAEDKPAKKKKKKEPGDDA